MSRPGKPDVFNYRQSHIYLADLFAWYKTKGCSMRSLATKLNVSVALLSLVARGKRQLTEENVDIWAPVFNWNAQEVSWLKQLILLEHPDVNRKEQALENLSRFKSYTESSPKEILTFKYLKKWWNVAIREMSELPDFQENEQWIQKRLQFKVSLTEIKKSLAFLDRHKLLAKYGPLRNIDCQGNVYKLSLSTFHNQMLDRAVESIHEVPAEKRYILGHTLAIQAEKFPEAKAILEEALEKIMKLHEDEANPSDVYHFALVGFPLTTNKDKI